MGVRVENSGDLKNEPGTFFSCCASSEIHTCKLLLYLDIFFFLTSEKELMIGNKTHNLENRAKQNDVEIDVDEKEDKECKTEKQTK